ncbi:MAG: flagellar motor switch protein FliN [Phycisphaeraceae bacterium]
MANDQTNNPADDVQDALAQAQASVDEIADIVQPQTPDFDTEIDPATGHAIELLGDVDLECSIELGRTEMLVEDVLRLAEGSVVELDKLAGDPVDVFVNGRLVARGEVLVLNDNFCIRISEIVANLAEEAQEAAVELTQRQDQEETQPAEA